MAKTTRTAPATTFIVAMPKPATHVELPVVLGARRAFTYEIVPDPAAGERAKAPFAGWLR